MLRQMRENTGSWIIKILLGIIVVAFVFIGFGSFGSKNRNSVASVNGEDITLKEYKKSYEDTVARLKSRFGNNINAELLKAFNVKQQALDLLIEEKLINAQAEKLNINVSEKELQHSLLSIPAFQENGSFNISKYNRVLGVNRMNPEIFEELQTNSLKMQKVRNLVFDSITVSDIEAENWYIYNNTKVKVNYIKFDPDSYNNLEPSQKAISEYYELNKNQFMSSPERKASYLVFSPDMYQNKIKIDSAKIEEYYQNNPNEFFTPEKVEARHILIKVPQDADDKVVEEKRQQILKIHDKAVNGEEFSELAKQYSEGPSKDSGGYLGSFERGAMVKPFADKAFAMKVNEISEPVRTQFGWHLIKVVGKFEASTQTLDQVSEKIKQDLMANELENAAYYEAGKAFDAIIDGDDLEQAALLTNTSVKNTEFFSSIGNGLNIPNARAFANFSFELEINNISDVKKIGDAYYLIKVTDVKEPELLGLDKVQEEISATLKDQMQLEHAKKLANEFLTAINNTPDSMKKLADEKKLEIKSTQFFGRNDTLEDIGRAADFINASFSLAEKKNVYPEIIETDKGFFIISLNEKKPPEQSEIKSNLLATKEQLETSKQDAVYSTWLENLKQNSVITVNTELFN